MVKKKLQNLPTFVFLQIYPFKRMDTAKSLRNNLPNINTYNFESHAMALFNWQVVHNQVYASFVKHLAVEVESIKKIEDIPFLPIQFFKSQQVVTGQWQPEQVFESSGTTGTIPSRHYVKSLPFYHAHARNLFEQTFGNLTDMHILALLPSYIERQGSSLVSMVQYFIQQAATSYSGFYLQNTNKLVATLEKLRSSSKKTILFGVSFALLELAERYALDLSHVTLIETGGMKGRRKELTRAELYDKLNARLNFGAIYSEYGMTELLSQAYGLQGKFMQPNTMKILIRQVNDPFSYEPVGRTGGINIIDLANVDSCAFIETQDLGRLHPAGGFEVLGRFDNSDLRGCNLLVQ